MHRRWYDTYPVQFVVGFSLVVIISQLLTQAFGHVSENITFALFIIIMIAIFIFRGNRNNKRKIELSLDIPIPTKILTQLDTITHPYRHGTFFHPIEYYITTKYTHPTTNKTYYFNSPYLLSELPGIINTPISRIKTAAMHTVQQFGGIPVDLDGKGNYQFCESPIFHIEKLPNRKQAISYAAGCVFYPLITLIIIITLVFVFGILFGKTNFHFQFAKY